MSSASIFVCEDDLGPWRRPCVVGEAARRSGTGGATSRSRRCRVQSPPRSTLRRHVGQRHDRADRLALAVELERRHVALDPVVVRGERGGARQLDGAVLADQPAARTGRGGRRRDQTDHHEQSADGSGDDPGRANTRPSGQHGTSLLGPGYEARMWELALTTLRPPDRFPAPRSSIAEIPGT